MLLFYGVPFIAFINYFDAHKREKWSLPKDEKPQKRSNEESLKIYTMAIDFLKAKKYDLALQMFKKIPNYKDSKKQIKDLENK